MVRASWRVVLCVGAALSVGGLSACDIEGFGEIVGGECTLIGCHDMLTVAFSPPVDDDYDVQLVLDGAIVGFDCEDGQVVGGGGQVIACDAAGFQLLTTASTVEVAASGNVAMWEAFGSGAPDVEEVRPNGPDCEPVCLQGTFSVATQQL